MIVEATDLYGDDTTEMIIDPFEVMCSISRDWRISIGVNSNSPIMGGYWMSVAMTALGEYAYERIRLATREEIIHFEALKDITTLVAKFYQ